MATTRQQRRASDRVAARRRGEARRKGRALIGVGVAAAVALAWLGYQWTATWPVVREGAPAWSPDSTRLAFFREQSNHKADLFVMAANGTGVEQLTFTDQADEGGPAFSPDGLRIAYDTDVDGNFEIYTIDLTSRARQRLTEHPGRDVAPAWSPDGTRIAFMSDRDSAPEFDLYLMDPDGGHVERLTSGGTYWFPRFSPDGTELAFHLWRDVHVMDFATRVVRRLTTDPANGMYPTWSPDGRQIAFMSWRNGRTELFVMDADGSRQRVLVSSPGGDAIDPRWSPDGTRIAYVQLPKTTLGGNQDSDPNAARAIYVLDIQSGRVTRLSR
jgi:Tol biopolymer transport system component